MQRAYEEYVNRKAQKKREQKEKYSFDRISGLIHPDYSNAQPRVMDFDKKNNFEELLYKQI
jgi:hypothetical protein